MRKIQSPVVLFFKEIQLIWVSERPNQMAAALAYFSLFSLAPVIYIALVVAGIFINQVAAGDRLYTRVATALGSETADLIVALLQEVQPSSSTESILLTLISFGALLYAASGVFFHLQLVMNKLWQVPLEVSRSRRVLIRQRLFAFLMTIGIGLLLVGAAIASLVINWLSSLLLLGRFESVSSLLAFVGLGAVSFALIFKYIPDVKIGWRDVWIGAGVTALLMTVGGGLIVLYLRWSSVRSALQAAGAVAVILIGIYYLAQIFLFGVIFTRVYARRYGSLRE